MLRPGETRLTKYLTEGLSSASISDALRRLRDHRAAVTDLVSPTPHRTLFGRTAMIRFVPFREGLFDSNQHSFARFYYEAIGHAPDGKVLVLDSAGQSHTSIGGATKFSRLHHDSLVGLTTDGRIRDFVELASYDPTFYCRGEAVRAGTGIRRTRHRGAGVAHTARAHEDAFGARKPQCQGMAGCRNHGESQRGVAVGTQSTD